MLVAHLAYLSHAGELFRATTEDGGHAVTELSREAVLKWLAGLSDGQWLELMTTACKQRGGDQNR
jgi:hypothetical protein